jgi:hypothetical protein
VGKENDMSKLMLKADIIEGLTPADIEYGFKDVRVHRGSIDAAKANRLEKFFRREYVTIKNLATGKSIVRRVYGHNCFYDDQYKKEHNAPFPKNAIALHYDDRDELGIRDFREPVDVVLYRTTLPERMAYYWNHDEPAVRIANRFGAIAIVISTKDFVDLVELVAGLVTRAFA